MRVLQIESVSRLRRMAPAWDRLWAESETTLPTARAELVAQWVEHFAAGSPLRIVAVEADGQLAAALPLVGRRIAGVVPLLDLTRNWWSPNGELLLAPEAEESAVRRLAGALLGLGWPAVWLEVVPIRSPAWRRLVRALAERGARLDVHVRGHSATLQCQETFAAYEASLSSRQRYNLRRNRKRLAQLGELRTDVHSTFTTAEVKGQLTSAFQIERRSWKGRRGQTVLDTPGMFDFFCRQACTLADYGYLRLAFLQLDGKPIAFELGALAKGVYHSAKIGFDRMYRRYGPGQLLRYDLVRWFHLQPECRGADFHAQPVGGLARWSNASYPVARLVIATGGWPGAVCLAAYKATAQAIRRLRAASGRRQSGHLPAPEGESLRWLTTQAGSEAQPPAP